MRARVVLCLWPGLLPLWVHGAWTGLVTAALFSLLLNFALVVTFVWFETISPAARSALWWMLGAAWVGFAVWGLRRAAAESTESKMSRSVDLFRQAQSEYLRGNWVESELQILKLLDANPSDCDARLMLAALYRHTDRIDEARHELQHLESLESAVKWRWEIENERRLLDESATTSPGDPQPDSQPAPPAATETEAQAA